MRRIFATDMPATIAAITCLLVFLVCFFSLRSVGRYLASGELARHTDVLARGLKEAVTGTRNELEQLPPVEGLNCQNGTSDVLAQQVFENPYVRWMGVRQAGKMICRSGIVNRDPGPLAHVHPINDVWSVELVDGNPSTVYVIQRRGDAEYIAIPERMLFDFESSIDCPQCVAYDLDVHEPNFEVRVGDWNRVVLRRMEEATIGSAHATLTLGVLQRYVDKFQSSGHILAACISAIVALILSFLLYGLLVRQTSMASLIRQGLRRNEFLPYYQPIVDASSGTVLGAEALVRWHSRARVIPPGQFVPLAEEKGLIGPITDQVVTKVLKDIKDLGWVGSNRYISINADPDQILKTDFCESLVKQLADSGIPGKNIAVEITERRQVADLAAGRHRLLCLAEAGVDIKIDDAGTGFGGFSYVQELPVSTLKIDKMFIDTLRAEGDAKRPVLDAIIQFARKSGLSTVAEGVETKEQVAYLVKAGVHAIQGYVYSRPMPVKKLIGWVEEHEMETARINAGF